MKMKRILQRFPLASLLLPFLMLIVAVFPIISNVHASGDASPSAKIFLCPSDYVVTEPGGTLTVEIKIADVSDLAGFELKLGYDTELLNVLEIVEGSFLKSFGATDQLILETNETGGYVWLSFALFDLTAAEGDGVLATVKFECTSTGECLFDLYDTILVNSRASLINHYVTDGYSVNEYVDPPSPYVSDPMEAGWMIRDEKGLDGYVECDYSDVTYTSAPTSLLAHVWGWGTRGEDYATLYINKTFTWQPNMALTQLKLNYLIDSMTDGDVWGGMAVLTQIKVVTHDTTGAHEYTYIVAGATTNVNDWSFDFCRYRGPDVKYINWLNEEIPAPGHNELEPPTGIWYTLDRNVDADFMISWSTVTTVEIEIAHGGGYLHQDQFAAYFDDLELNIERATLAARFTVTPETATAGETITFDASGSSPGWDGTNEIPITEYGWNFGDGNFATTSDPTIQYYYDAPGFYYVTLAVHAPGSVPEYDSSTNTVTIVAMGPPPNAQFTYAPTAPGILEPVVFDGSSSTPDGGTIVEYYWDFGDGEYAAGQIVNHGYSSAGVFTVTLSVLDSDGSWDTEQKQIEVTSSIPLDFNNDGVVDSVDFQILKHAIPSVPGSPKWNPKCDLNHDNAVTITDYVLFKRDAPLYDTAPPVTEIILAGTPGANGWYRSEVSVTLDATDWICDLWQDPGNVKRTDYSYDQLSWILYTEPFVVTAQGSTTIYYRSIDLLDNVEATKSGIIKIDETAPYITVLAPQQRDYVDTESLTVDFSATDALSGVASVTAVLGLDPATICVDPQVSSAAVGTDFIISLNISEVYDLCAWQVFLKWDPAALDFVQWTEGPFLKPGGPTGVDSSVDQTEGTIMMMCWADTGVSGDGTLATVEFYVETEGESTLHIDTEWTGLIDAEANWIPYAAIDGYVTSYYLPEEHDIAVTSVTTDKTIVTAGDPVTITVTAENQGTRIETFDVTVFCDSTAIGAQTYISLNPGQETSIAIAWDTTTTGIGAHQISAQATVVLGEIDTVDNKMVNGFVQVKIYVYAGQVIDLSGWQFSKYTLTVTAIDFAGNEATQSVTFVVVTTLSGIVTNEYTKEPIQGVEIGIPETGASAVTNERGEYSFVIRAAGTYTIEMSLPYGYLTHDDVTKFIEVTESKMVNFNVYAASWLGATVPRTIGYWKEWNVDHHYTTEIMAALVANVRSSSGLFGDLTVDNVASRLAMTYFTMKQKGEAQLLASWLNVVSTKLGVDVRVDLKSIKDWTQVISIQEGSILTVDELLRQIDNLYATDANLSNPQWEIVKNILDSLNNGRLFLKQ